MDDIPVSPVIFTPLRVFLVLFQPVQVISYLPASQRPEFSRPHQSAEFSQVFSLLCKAIVFFECKRKVVHLFQKIPAFVHCTAVVKVREQFSHHEQLRLFCDALPFPQILPEHFLHIRIQQNGKAQICINIDQLNPTAAVFSVRTGQSIHIGQQRIIGLEYPDCIVLIFHFVQTLHDTAVFLFYCAAEPSAASFLPLLGVPHFIVFQRFQKFYWDSDLPKTER